MLLLEKLSYEYDQLLIRDLGFYSGPWKKMILGISEVLGIDSFGGVSLSEAHKNPGIEAIKLFISSWTSKRGKYWDRLVEIQEDFKSSPYSDKRGYKFHIKTREELISELTGEEVFMEYHNIIYLFDSQDYKTLKQLEGLSNI